MKSEKNECKILQNIAPTLHWFLFVIPQWHRKDVQNSIPMICEKKDHSCDGNCTNRLPFADGKKTGESGEILKDVVIEI